MKKGLRLLIPLVGMPLLVVWGGWKLGDRFYAWGILGMVILTQALFFAGPVQYFARYLGHTSREVFDAASLNFPLSVKLEAVGLYLLFFTMAIIAGYLAGHARRNRELEEHETWSRRLSNRPEQTWTREDADAAWHDENPA